MSLKRNTAWNLAGTGSPLLLGVFAIPYLIESIGLEAFGILTLIWTLIGYLSLFDFGLGRALTQQVASSLSSGDEAGVPRLVKSGLVFTGITGLIGALILASLALPLGYRWLNVSVALQAQATCSLLIAAIGIPFTTATTSLRGVLEAYEEFGAVNLLRIGLGTANFALPVLSVLLFGPSLAYIVAALVGVRLLILVAFWSRVSNKLSYRWVKAVASGADVKRLFGFGAWMTVSNVISPLMVTADRFLVAAVMGAGAVAYYTVPHEMLVRLLVIPGALTAALFPRLAFTLKAEPGIAKMLYARSVRSVCFVLGPICTLVGASAYWWLSIWLGHGFAENAWITVCILSVGVFINGVAAVPFAAVQAAGDAKATAILHIFELLLYVPLLFGLLHLWGVAGAALAWTLRVALDASLLLWLVERRFSMVGVRA